ncbi:DUF4381 family protein [Verrucomicrobiota bacterium sgz303538]
MSTPAELIEDLRLLEPPNPWMLYYWIAAGLAAVLLIVLLLFVIRAVWRRRASLSHDHAWAAREEALAALENLYELVKQEHGRQYAIESSSVIRRYIEQRFEIRASMCSTEEFLHEAQHSPSLEPEYQELLGQFLGWCDFIKFGRGIADREDLDQLHTAAIDFVKNSGNGEVAE